MVVLEIIKKYGKEDRGMNKQLQLTKTGYILSSDTFDDLADGVCFYYDVIREGLGGFIMNKANAIAEAKNNDGEKPVVPVRVRVSVTFNVEEVK